jgi:hypothetical protein
MGFLMVVSLVSFRTRRAAWGERVRDLLFNLVGLPAESDKRLPGVIPSRLGGLHFILNGQRPLESEERPLLSLKARVIDGPESLGAAPLTIPDGVQEVVDGKGGEEQSPDGQGIPHAINARSGPRYPSHENDNIEHIDHADLPPSRPVGPRILYSARPSVNGTKVPITHVTGVTA